MHHPRFSSSAHGNDARLESIWRTLYHYRTDIVLAGHDHVYERFRAQDADGRATTSGISEFVVGSGGKEHYAMRQIKPNSVTHDDHTFGVLELTLGRSGYAWRFVPLPPGRFQESGRASCH